MLAYLVIMVRPNQLKGSISFALVFNVNFVSSSSAHKLSYCAYRFLLYSNASTINFHHVHKGFAQPLSHPSLYVHILQRRETLCALVSYRSPSYQHLRSRISSLATHIGMSTISIPLDTIKVLRQQPGLHTDNTTALPTSPTVKMPSTPMSSRPPHTDLPELDTSVADRLRGMMRYNLYGDCYRHSSCSYYADFMMTDISFTDGWLGLHFEARLERIAEYRAHYNDRFGFGNDDKPLEPQKHQRLPEPLTKDL